MQWFDFCFNWEGRFQGLHGGKPAIASPTKPLTQPNAPTQHQPHQSINNNHNQQPQPINNNRYEAYMKLFEPLCGPGPGRPIITEGAVKVMVGQKRSREAGDDAALDDGALPKKKVRYLVAAAVRPKHGTHDLTQLTHSAHALHTSITNTHYHYAHYY
jgi:hypothetical protein